MSNSLSHIRENERLRALSVATKICNALLETTPTEISAQSLNFAMMVPHVVELLPPRRPTLLTMITATVKTTTDDVR